MGQSLPQCGRDNNWPLRFDTTRGLHGRLLQGAGPSRRGRPLRRHFSPPRQVPGGAQQLTVIDYIGNHRTFLLKPQTLFNLPTGGQEVLNLLERLSPEGEIEIAPGCFVTYELETIDILRALARVSVNRQDALKRYYEGFLELHGTRPRAVEAFHEGDNPRAMRPATGSWLAFVHSQGGLEPDQARAYVACQSRYSRDGASCLGSGTDTRLPCSAQ